MNTTPKIRLKNVHKAFGRKAVLSGIDLNIETGESLVIIGGSGTGKSVTLKCILGLLVPDLGSIEVDGKDVLKMNSIAREKANMQIGMLFQHAALFDSLTVWQNVAFGLMTKKNYSTRKAEAIAIEKMALVGLSPNTSKLYPADLSAGMQKRVGLARAIAGEPSIIFFDEPTTGLDPIMADIINKLIVQVNQTSGVTALTITHDMASATEIGNKIAMLHNGKIVWSGLSSDIYRSENEYLDQFIHGRTIGPIKMSLRA